MASGSVGRWAGIGLTLVFMGGCTIEPPLPTTPPDNSREASPDDSRGTSDVDSLEALYDYCDQATEPDPKCWSSMFGNNRRALDNWLDGNDEHGGQKAMEVDGAQGLGAVAPVGTDVNFVSSTLPGINFVTDDTNSAGECRTAYDSTAEIGVVTVLTDGPRGPREIVQAYIIRNPVFRMGRRLSEEAAGLGSAGIGTMSSLADLQAVYPEIEVVGEGPKIAVTPPEQAREHPEIGEDRVMIFLLDGDDRVEQWVIGVPQYAQNFCH